MEKDCYVKFGYGWVLFNKGENTFLSNVFKSSLFSVSEEYQDIAIDINNGIALSEIRLRHGVRWEEFKRQLESNNAIYYSTSSGGVIDSLNHGNILSLISTYIKQPLQIAQFVIQINNQCSLNCLECNEESMYECLSCHKAKGNQIKRIDFHIVKGAIEFFSNFGIASILIQGGDPLLDFDLLTKTIDVFYTHNPQGVVFVETNASEIAIIDQTKIEYLKNKCNLIIIVTSQNYSSYEDIKARLKKNNISFSVIAKNVTLEDEKLQRNDSISYLDKTNKPIVKRSDISKPLSLYENTINDIFVPCIFHRLFLSVDEQIGVCANYLIEKITRETPLNEVANKLESQWRIQYAAECDNCELKKLCRSCVFLQNKYAGRSSNMLACFSTEENN